MASMLPLEILGLIVDEIDSVDLSNVSLVSSVFRQLAQERLFSHITLRENPTDAGEQLLQLARLPHLASRIRSLEANVFSFVEQDEIYGYERMGKDEDTIILQEATGSVCRLSFRLIPVMLLCQNRLESLTLIGPQRGYEEDDDTSECLFLSIFAELLAGFDFPRFRELNLSGFDARCFWALYGKLKENNNPSSDILRSNYKRLKHFQVDDCTDRNPFDLDNDDGELLSHLAPIMKLQSLCIVDNDNFLITMKHVTANCDNLAQIHLREIAGRGFERFVSNCPRVSDISFSRVEMLEPEEHNEAQETWADVFHALRKHKTKRSKIVMNHLRYETAVRWGIQGMGFPKFWDYHDTICGDDERKVLCSNLDRFQYVTDQKALNELYRALGEREEEVNSCCTEVADAMVVDVKEMAEVRYIEVLSESEDEMDVRLLV